MGRLSGSVAIVTGAAGGIGLGIAERFALEGATVVATDVQVLTRDSAVEVREHDVTDAGQWKALVDDVVAAHGKVDVLVNNAGVAGYHDIVETSVDEWQRIVAINQTGVLFGMQTVIPAMRANGAGSIINISSICGSTAVPGVAAYHATKGAVITMTKNAAVSYARDGIRANVILPGWIKTPMTVGQTDELNARYLDATPLGHGADPEDIAWGAVYLASRESAFVTGVELPIDGGYLAQ